MASMTILGAINENPLAGSMVLVALLIIHQIVSKFAGNKNAARIEIESNKLARQTSETVNACATKTSEVVSKIEKYIQSDNVGRLSTRLEQSIFMLEKMATNQGLFEESLDRIIDICDSINVDLQRTDSRVVHERLLHEVDTVKTIAKDVKRLTVHIAEKI